MKELSNVLVEKTAEIFRHSPIHFIIIKLTPSMKLKQNRFLLASFCFHDSKPCVTLWKCTVLPANPEPVCEGWGRSFSVQPCESRPLTHFRSSMYDFADSWPWGSLGCGYELDLNSLIPSETTGISGSHPPACNETFGKNKGDLNTKK